MPSLILPQPLRSQIVAESRTAFPRECCGLIEGARDGETIRALALHPARNLAPEPDRFEIDPLEQFALLRALRGTDRGIVGCYHSHPNGIAEPSPRDAQQAGESGFVWIVAGVGASVTLGAFVWDGTVFRPLATREPAWA